MPTSAAPTQINLQINRTEILNHPTHQIVIKRKENDFQMMTTVPFTGQPTNGVSITRISMVTTSDPAIHLLMILIHLISPAPRPVAQQDHNSPIEIVHQHRYIFIKDNKIHDSPIPTATSVYHPIQIIPTRTLEEIDTRIDREIHITLVITQTP